MSDRIPLDLMPGVSPQMRERLIAWRNNEETRWVMGLLSQFKPVTGAMVNPDAASPTGAAIRLGAREGYDALYSQIFLIGMVDHPPAPTRVPTKYGGKTHEHDAGFDGAGRRKNGGKRVRPVAPGPEATGG